MVEKVIDWFLRYWDWDKDYLGQNNVKTNISILGVWLMKIRDENGGRVEDENKDWTYVLA